MKTKTTYVCEICGSDYENPDNALECESQGIGKTYPTGMIFAHNDNGLYGNIIFAVASNRVDGHSNSISAWAARDGANYRDSFGNHKCMSPTNIMNKWYARINPIMPAFNRMVDWLKSVNVPVTVWNGERPVPLDEWLNSPAAKLYLNPD